MLDQGTFFSGSPPEVDEFREISFGPAKCLLDDEDDEAIVSVYERDWQDFNTFQVLCDLAVNGIPQVGRAMDDLALFFSLLPRGKGGRGNV